ncbi:hypothetical protein D9619_009775 [Psilocybe cf. subviscida]|uniref:Protein kinase domain-containing protein n=1 Tax=Psilocybe cf. subviscida TaxID=2480587 RepID=A0A8H5BL74_9AGAR|nr:hypothetical protein D9619_009775 [Psilocybe cf. subviscida]
MSTTTTATASSVVGDSNKLEIFQHSKKILHSTTMSLLIFDEKYFVKVLENVTDLTVPSDLSIMPEQARITAMEHEISMMEAAGEVCAFQPLGRVLLNGAVVGYIAHLGVCYPATLPPYFRHSETLLGGPSFTFPSAQEFIDDLVPLVHRLHDRGVLHGDIKPSNLLYCKRTSRFLFCDFGSARLVESTDEIDASTAQYTSPARAHGARHPLSKEDDLYATGITVWELASSSGECPFHDVDGDHIEDIITAGFQPNIYLVKDVATRQLIRSLLDAGFPQTSAFSPASCIASEVAYAECIADPPHTYTKMVHGSKCGEGNNCNMDSIYHAPSSLSHVENLPCQLCTAGSDYVLTDLVPPVT